MGFFAELSASLRTLLTTNATTNVGATNLQMSASYASRSHRQRLDQLVDQRRVRPSHGTQQQEGNQNGAPITPIEEAPSTAAQPPQRTSKKPSAPKAQDTQNQ